MTGGRRPCIVVLIRSFGFPEGMAATHRVRLLGRALLEQGIDVTVLCTRVSERPGEIINRHTRGVCDGIPFRYATSSTLRSPSFVVRRCEEVRGFLVALQELTSRRCARRLDCVYVAEVSMSWWPNLWLLRRALALLGVPVIAELNELPGAATWLPASLSRRLSHLSGVAGVTAISASLAEWATLEARRIGRSIEIIEVPIVIDVGEQDLTPYLHGEPMFVYSASNAYSEVAAFIFRAMRLVWERYPQCSVTVTGMRADMVARMAKSEGLDAEIADGRIVIAGFVDRDRLIELYRAAAALLIPLADDDVSRARFPTKVGEYLASARPVVTTDVGEISRFLKDGETAYVARRGAVADYAAKLMDVLDDPERAARVGLAGRQLCTEDFLFSRQGPPLARLIERVAGQGGARSGGGEACACDRVSAGARRLFDVARHRPDGGRIS